MSKEYRWIPGLEGKYQVSEDGEVRSFARSRTGRVMKQRVHKGYRRINLRVGETRKTLSTHRLVASAFYPGVTNQLVRHLDGNSLNNHYTNLAWGTYKENSADMVRHGRAPKKINSSHCPEGHELTLDNIVLRSNGSPRCRRCRKASNQRAWAKYRAKNF